MALASGSEPYRIDMPVAQLKTPGLLVVSCLRLWAQHYADPYGQHARWIKGLEAAGLPASAGGAFDSLMRIIAVTATRSLDVRSLASPHLGADEASLLALLQSLQNKEKQTANGWLASLLPPSATRLALREADAFAQVMLEKGLDLQQSKISAPAVTPARFVADRGVHLLH